MRELRRLLPVRSRAKEFVELYDQVQVRILSPTAFDMLTSYRLV
jgi:hypothetical protein